MEMIDCVDPLTDPTAHGGRAEDAFDLVLRPSPREPKLLVPLVGRLLPVSAVLRADAEVVLLPAGLPHLGVGRPTWCGGVILDPPARVPPLGPLELLRMAALLPVHGLHGFLLVAFRLCHARRCRSAPAAKHRSRPSGLQTDAA